MYVCDMGQTWMFWHYWQTNQCVMGGLVTCQVSVSCCGSSTLHWHSLSCTQTSTIPDNQHLMYWTSSFLLLSSMCPLFHKCSSFPLLNLFKSEVTKFKAYFRKHHPQYSFRIQRTIYSVCGPRENFSGASERVPLMLPVANRPLFRVEKCTWEVSI